MRLLATSICAALVLAIPAKANDDFNWQIASDRKTILGSFSNFTNFCNDFGYQRVALPMGTDLDKKMHAHLLLATSAEYELDKWVTYVNDWTQLTDAMKDEALLDRAADALIAAENDPAAYTKAETLYMDTVMKPLTRAFNACGAASRDEFVGKYFISGTGSLDPTKERIRASFEGGMKEIWAEAKKPQSK